MHQDTAPPAKSGKLKYILLGLCGGAFLFCCLPLSCLTIIGGTGSVAERAAQARDRAEQRASGRGSEDFSSTAESKPLGGSTAEEGVSSFMPLGSPTPPAPAPIPSRRATEAPKSNTITARLREGFQLGEFRYTVLDRTGTDAIGTDFMGTFVGERAAEGATFVIVTYKIENLSNQTQTVLTSDFSLVDARGREFKPSSRGETALMMSDAAGDGSGNSKDFLLSQLQPGIPKTTKQVFEIPWESATTKGLKLRIPEKGFLSRGKAEVPLN